MQLLANVWGALDWACTDPILFTGTILFTAPTLFIFAPILFIFAPSLLTGYYFVYTF